MPRRRYKTHFPRANNTRTLCGAYITGRQHLVSISATANFKLVTCSECRQHPMFSEALMAFEIGEYSWAAWLKQYENPVKPESCPPAVKYASAHEAIEASQREREAQRKFKEDLLEKFEARAKKR